ncbi:MAG: hypothetical protein ACFFFT_00020 [Candidatus Thorarchaeota archaeon]
MNEKVEIALAKELHQRVQKISEALDIPLDTIINVCLLDGIFPLWLPYQKLLNDISDKESPIKEEDYQDILYWLSTHVHSNIESIENLSSLENEFEEEYPFGSFQDLQERRDEFIKFLRSYNEVEDIEVEEIPERPVSEKIKKVKIGSVEEEEEMPPSIFSKFTRFIKSQINSCVNSVLDGVLLGIFLVILGVVNFFMFYALYRTWPIMFDFGYIITTYAPWISVINIMMVILLFPVIILLTGFIIGKIYYSIIKRFRKKG